MKAWTMATCAVLLFACGGAQSPAQRDDSVPPPISDSPAPSAPPPSSGNHDYDQGVAALASGDVDGAKAADGRILAKDPKSGEGKVLLGLIDEKTGDKAGAEKAYKDAIAARPDLEAAYVDLSALLIDAQRGDEALTVARAGLAKVPASSGLHANVATVLAANGDQAGASSEFDAAVKGAPGDAALLMTYGHWLGVWKQRDAALAKLRAARPLAKDPGILAAVAEEMKAIGAFSDCVPVLDDAIQLKDAPELRTYRAVCKLGAKDDAGAKADLQAAIAAKYAPAHFYMARVDEGASDWKGAVAEYEAFLQLEPNVPAAKAAREKLKAAKKHLEK
jgi:Tfp pilus assembly protein PilF